MSSDRENASWNIFLCRDVRWKSVSFSLNGRRRLGFYWKSTHAGDRRVHWRWAFLQYLIRSRETLIYTFSDRAGGVARSGGPCVTLPEEILKKKKTYFRRRFFDFFRGKNSLTVVLCHWSELNSLEFNSDKTFLKKDYIRSIIFDSNRKSYSTS